ncbi:MAG TPA: DUF1194 domain-containing protein, partial [Bauldia sp.]|nr:DUF1194 domain-containing protein [Bauldia sp.]
MARIALITAAAVSLFTPHAALAAPPEVDLALVLAVDVSRSMTPDEQHLQRDGYVEAFRHPEVIQAIQSGALGQIAVTYVEWAGPYYHNITVPWTVVASAADANTFADKLAAAPIGHEFGTSISSGIEFANSLFASSGVTDDRRTIDVSGDGPNNAGSPVTPMRDAAVESGVTINGLPIMLHAADYFGIPDLDAYYRDCVIGGPGAFMIAVTGTLNFEDATRRKLVTEIADASRPHLSPDARIVRVADINPPSSAA